MLLKIFGARDSKIAFLRKGLVPKIYHVQSSAPSAQLKARSDLTDLRLVRGPQEEFFKYLGR